MLYLDKFAKSNLEMSSKRITKKKKKYAMLHVTIPSKIFIAFSIIIVPQLYDQLLCDGWGHVTLVPYNMLHTHTYQTYEIKLY